MDQVLTSVVEAVEQRALHVVGGARMGVQLERELVGPPIQGVGQQATAEVAVRPTRIGRPAAAQEEVGARALVRDQRVDDRRLQRIETSGQG